MLGLLLAGALIGLLLYVIVLWIDLVHPFVIKLCLVGFGGALIFFGASHNVTPFWVVGLFLALWGATP